MEKFRSYCKSLLEADDNFNSMEKPYQEGSPMDLSELINSRYAEFDNQLEDLRKELKQFDRVGEDSSVGAIIQQIEKLESMLRKLREENSDDITREEMDDEYGGFDPDEVEHVTPVTDTDDFNRLQV